MNDIPASCFHVSLPDSQMSGKQTCDGGQTSEPKEAQLLSWNGAFDGCVSGGWGWRSCNLSPAPALLSDARQWFSALQLVFLAVFHRRPSGHPPGVRPRHRRQFSVCVSVCVSVCLYGRSLGSEVTGKSWSIAMVTGPPLRSLIFRPFFASSSCRSL